MDFEKNFEKKCNPILDITGMIENGTQYDLDITLPEDNKGAIFGVVKDCKGRPVKEAIVKLIEVECTREGEKRCPVTHTFTNCEGEFLFGPLCPNKFYEVQIWQNDVRHVKICAKPEIERDCLKCHCHDKCDFIICKEGKFDKCEKRLDKCEDKCDC